MRRAAFGRSPGPVAMGMAASLSYFRPDRSALGPYKMLFNICSLVLEAFTATDTDLIEAQAQLWCSYFTRLCEGRPTRSFKLANMSHRQLSVFQ